MCCLAALHDIVVLRGHAPFLFRAEASASVGPAALSV